MPLKNRGTSILRWFVRVRPILWRALLCWVLGCILLLNDQAGSLDVRFQLRGDQPGVPSIVIITIHPDEVLANYRLRGRLSTWKDVGDLTDSFYWDPLVWKKLLNQLLAQNPRSVGVTLFLSDNLNRSALDDQDLTLFRDPRVFWAAQTPSTGERTNRPLFSDHIGGYELTRDEDGVIRRFGPSTFGFPHLVEQMTGIHYTEPNSQLINYRGGPNVWPEYSLSEVIAGGLPPDTFKDKYVLIGAENNSNSQFLTPLGPTNRAGVMAHIADNMLANRWVKRAPISLFTFLLFALLVVCVFTLIRYPSTVAGVFLLWIVTLISALSIWIFDTFSIWTPVFSPAVQMVATWVIFLGYQANRFERKHAELKQQQRNSLELEQLKNNFISLISHDLKTPIAKSQAVVDRLLTGTYPVELQDDLHLLRRFNEELHRYIQSILKLLRVESRNFQLTLELGDINETIEDVVRQVHPLAQTKNLNLKTDLEPLFTIEGDFTLLREVILNLVENAVKYTPADGSIHIKSFERNDEVVIEVADTGPGIPKEEIDSVWRKFVRGKGQEHRTSGTGLGLYLVKYFIELHGGSVQLESALGRGTKVTVRLPLEHKDEQTDSTSSAESLPLGLTGVNHG